VNPVPTLLEGVWKAEGITAEFMDRNVPKHLPRDVALCFLRVAQEALHNAAKYSRTSRFVVELTGLANEVQLEVKDGGAGFDVEAAKQNRGLGLVTCRNE